MIEAMIADGRIFSLVAMLALLFFLSERMLPPGPLRRTARVAAAGILGLGLAAAIVWSILWLLGGGMSGMGMSGSGR